VQYCELTNNRICQGYKNAADAFINEANVKGIDQLAEESRSLVAEASIPEFILFYNETEANNPSAYEHSYGRLRKWIEESMDKYKVANRQGRFGVAIY
jgi:transcription initiation factor TFIID subunit 5